MVTKNDQVAQQTGAWVHVPVQVPDTVNDCPVTGLQFIHVNEPFEADIMIAREDDEGDPVPQGFKDAGHLVEFLPGQRGDAVFDIPEQDQVVGINLIDGLHQAFKPLARPASEMQAAGDKIRFDPKMRIRNNKVALIAFYQKCRAVANEGKVHNRLTYPFWGW